MENYSSTVEEIRTIIAKKSEFVADSFSTVVKGIIPKISEQHRKHVLFATRTIAKQTPDTNLKLETEGWAPLDFIEKANEKLREIQEQYIDLVLDLAEAAGANDGKSAVEILDNVPTVLERLQEQYRTYALNMTKKIGKHNGGAAKLFFTSLPIRLDKTPLLYRPLALEAMDKVIETMDKIHEKNYILLLEILEETPKVTTKLNPTKHYDADLLLLEYITDRKRADLIGKVVDMNKYGNEYRQKTAKLYSKS